MVFADSIANATDDNATTTLYALLRGMNAKVTRATVRDELAMHPDFPSLLSLSDLLTDWKIDNTALQLNTVEQLRELPMPFIAHLKKKGGWYVLVTELIGNRITYTDSHAGSRTETVEEFEKSWSGVVLLAEANEQSGEADYARNRPKEIRENLRGSFLLGGAFLIVLLVIPSVAKDLTAPDWLLLLTKSTGLLLSGLLVAKQLGGRNALTDRLCQFNSKTNCDSVLNSPGAKLWGWLSWADIGLVYFAGSLLAVLLTGVVPTVRPLLHWLALLALPYVIFSVFYQARVIRRWCTLCLAVQVVLLAESVLGATQLAALPGFWQPYVTLLMAFLLPTLAWVLIKPLLTKATKSRHEHDELLRLKQNPDLFQALLMQQPQMLPISHDMHPIVLGNPNAQHTIIMVTNPYCRPCSRMHKELDVLISRNTSVKANIVFTGDDGDGRVTEVAVQALALAEQGKAALALEEWYEQPEKKFDTWAKQHSVDLDKTHWKSIANQHSEWCKLADIIETPTLYLDGYKLPISYSLDNLRWLINELKPSPMFANVSI